MILAYMAANKTAFIVIFALMAFIAFRFIAPKAYETVDNVIVVIVKYLCAFLLFAMIAICFYNTTARYLFGHSPRWAEEIIRYSAVWVTCVGASMTARADNHTTMDLLQETVKNCKVRAVLYAFTRLLACTFLVLLIPAAFKMLEVYSHAFSNSVKFGTKRMPQNVLYYSFLVGSLSMVLGYLRIVPPKVKKIWTDTLEKSEFELINEGIITDDDDIAEKGEEK